MSVLDFYKDKKVLLTGHTGFKGSWMCRLLAMAGAEVTGYSLEAEEKSLFNICRAGEGMESVIGDIRDLEHLKEIFDRAQPEIVVHMAAQPLVRESYRNPVYTYETNVMGTVNVMECIRLTPSVKSVVNVTTDKVYENKEWVWGYRENENLNGYDPYSNSKSCSELVTDSYRNSFFRDRDIAVASCRAGNVIGGGDFAKDRIIPDCIRAAETGSPVVIRNPYAVRPFQHVIEPITAYLLIAWRQWEDRQLQGSYNVGPNESDSVSVGELADIFCECWGNGQEWLNQHDGGPHEANLLTLDCSKIKKKLGWRPIWDIREAVSRTVDWQKEYIQGKDMDIVMENQIEEYLRESES